MHLSRLLIASLLLGCPPLVGCGPGVSEEDLGTIVTELPQVPGADEPYPLPDFGTDEPVDEPTVDSLDAN